ncbi:TIGR02466 family protein [Polymorphospora rubra]|uniref:Fe2OG dioxygenase domain-containing protein n=1 Tax=Polymorphospora rubra TaxID=338584 RepID=A0A810N2D7_9ACTN|nr:TIGR02466 family protein [Polymorphospora rubra]BCJ65705.1 hypothetical protein Prubr_27260 [Polymorphospora rubra]
MRTFGMWGTPIVRDPNAVSPETLEDLRALVLREDARQRGTKIGTFNASKTESDLLVLSDPPLKVLRDAIVEIEGRMLSALRIEHEVTGRGVLAEAWGVVYHDWGFHRVHSHHDSAWSGVLYVDMGDSRDEDGQIEFLDPRPSACARHPGQPAVTTIKPATGEMILFPSWLEHWVTPHQGTRPRIVIAFNLGYGVAA